MAQHLSAVPYYPYQVSGSFYSLSRVLFTFPSRYSYAIGFRTYLGLEVDGPQIHTTFPSSATQDTLTPFLVTPTGLSPCIVLLSSRIRVTRRRLKECPITPHMDTISGTLSVCPLLFSVALTYSIPIGFFSCRY